MVAHRKLRNVYVEGRARTTVTRLRRMCWAGSRIPVRKLLTSPNAHARRLATGTFPIDRQEISNDESAPCTEASSMSAKPAE